MSSRRPVPDPVGPGQESVWDYPRPPAAEVSPRRVVVAFADDDGGGVLAASTRAVRVLETSHPPTWYLPRADVSGGLRPSAAPSTTCEFKGVATYWDVVTPTGALLEAAAWSYESPLPRYHVLAGAVSLRPGRLVCAVDGEVARPQEGSFSAGWITSDVVGPFKGGPGTWGW